MGDQSLPTLMHNVVLTICTVIKTNLQAELQLCRPGTQEYWSISVTPLSLSTSSSIRNFPVSSQPVLVRMAYAASAIISGFLDVAIMDSPPSISIAAVAIAGGMYINY